MAKTEETPIYQSDVDQTVYANKVVRVYNEVYEAADATTDEDADEKIVATEVNAQIRQNFYKKSAVCSFLIKIIPASLIGVGTGLAMMPIFNHLIKQSDVFGPDIHKNDYIFAVSTANTFVVYTYTSTTSAYYYFKNNMLNTTYASNCSKALLVGAKISASMSALVPLSLLWGIELQNQQLSKSSGFDQFVAWAAFTSLPLILYKSIDASKTVDLIYMNKDNINLNSTGAKVFVYTPVALSLVGRFIGYGAASYNISKAFGLDENTSMTLGAIGGSAGAISSAIFEYNSLKSLFKKYSDYTCKNVVGGIVSTIEGAWLAIPTVSIGLTAVSNWNPFVKVSIFAPLFLSETITQASNIYYAGEDLHESLSGHCCVNHDDN